MDWEDFEDAIQATSCFKVTDNLITRDKKGFSEAQEYLKIYTPEEYLAL